MLAFWSTLIYVTGDKSDAEAPGPSGFSISFKWFSKGFISEFFKKDLIMFLKQLCCNRLYVYMQLNSKRLEVAGL